MNDRSSARISRQVRFLIVSNPRSGSTWLAAMLGALPDATVDYELIWQHRGPPLAMVHSIPDEHFSCRDFLHRMAPLSRVVGAKLMMPCRPHTEQEYQQLRQTVERDIRVIHLTRDYREVYYSWQRGIYHQMASYQVDSGSRLQENMNLPPHREQLAAYLAMMADLQAEYRWKTRRRLQDLPRTLYLGARRRLSRLRCAWKGEPYSDFWTHRRDVSPEDCKELVRCLFAHDLWIDSLRANHRHFLRVAYRDIEQRFEEIVRFLGSNASPDEIRHIVATPSTVKLPSVPIEAFFDHAEQIIEICRTYEKRKVGHLQRSSPRPRRLKTSNA